MSRPLDFDAASDGSSSHLPIPAAGVLLSSEAVRALALGDLMADRYELLRELQSGIFLAYDRVAARNVRLVMFPPERAAAIKRISGMVVPTGLISIDDVQQTARGSFYTVELFDDTTLRADLVRRATTEHRFSVEEVRHLGEQLIEILEPLAYGRSRLFVRTVADRTGHSGQPVPIGGTAVRVVGGDTTETGLSSAGSNSQSGSPPTGSGPPAGTDGTRFEAVSFAACFWTRVDASDHRWCSHP